MVDFNKFLYNEKIGQIPTDYRGNEVPALLFANSSNKLYLGDIYLFSNFGISGGNTINSNSEITNNYVENNSQIQDHWAIAPTTYTLTGFIGEVVYKPARNWDNINIAGNNIQNYLAPLSVISPTVSSYVQTAMNTVHQIEANYQKFSNYARNFLNSINALGGVQSTQTNVYTIYQELIKLRNARVLVDVYTPYGELKNMAMVSIMMSEDENTKYKSSISITLQEYRDVESYVRLASEGEKKKLVKSEQLAQQTAEEKDNGIASFIKVDGNKSLLKQGVSAFINAGK